MRKFSSIFSVLILGASLILGFQNCGRNSDAPSEEAAASSTPPVISDIDTTLGSISALLASTTADPGTTADQLSANILLLQQLLAQLNAIDQSTLTPEQQLLLQQLIQQITDLIALLQAQLAALGSGPASCSLNGQVIASGASAIAYQNVTVPAGEMCVQESRSCTNGTLSGSYQFSSCVVGDPVVVCSLQPYLAQGAPVCGLPGGGNQSADHLGFNSLSIDQCSALCANEGVGSQCFYYSISSFSACFSCPAGTALRDSGGPKYSAFKAVCE